VDNIYKILDATGQALRSNQSAYNKFVELLKLQIVLSDINNPHYDAWHVTDLLFRFPIQRIVQWSYGSISCSVASDRISYLDSWKEVINGVCKNKQQINNLRGGDNVFEYTDLGGLVREIDTIKWFIKAKRYVAIFGISQIAFNDQKSKGKPFGDLLDPATMTVIEVTHPRDLNKKFEQYNWAKQAGLHSLDVAMAISSPNQLDIHRQGGYKETWKECPDCKEVVIIPYKRNWNFCPVCQKKLP
jgi:hypothetical protein